MLLKKLLKQAAKGNRLAQKSLFDQYAHGMMHVCLRYMIRVEVAEDCLMTGFMKAFLNLGALQIKKESDFRRWLVTIMINECLMQLRKNEIEYTSIEQAADSFVKNEIEEGLAAKDIHKQISLLPEGYRTVFNLYVIDGYSHQEIAHKLGINIGTSKSQLARARKILQEKFIDYAEQR